MKKSLKISLTVIATSLMLSSCGNTSSTIAKIPLVPALSEKEVIDYYAKELSYDNVISRNISVENTNYVTSEVSEQENNILKTKLSDIESALSQSSFTDNANVSRDQYEYFKTLVDSQQLSPNGAIKAASYLEYYFVDVTYKTTENTAGSFKNASKYLGIHGAYTTDGVSPLSLDVDFLTGINNKLMKSNSTSASSILLDAETISDRAVNPNITIINTEVGGSLTQTADMPELNLVFQPKTAGLAGYGILPEGSLGLKQILKTNSVSGDLTIRYIFKKDILTSEISFYTMHPVSYKSNVDTSTMNDELVPEFLKTDLSVVVEKYDRAISNNDITALVAGSITNDIGFGVLNGVYQKHTHLIRHISKLDKVLYRGNNEYIAAVETIVQGGIKGNYTYGTYKYKYIYLIKQEGTKLYIADRITTSIESIKNPGLEKDSSIVKRLAALGLRGEVDDKSKQDINTLLKDLYDGSTTRTLSKMYDCFDSDTALLSSARKEYLNSQLRSWLTKYGVEVNSQYNGHVIEWMGGSDKQVELIVEEVITYDNKDSSQYMQNYYLVSSLDGKWVIDDIKTLELKQITTQEAKDILGKMQ